MIISNQKVLELNKRYNLIENLSLRETENAEGVGLDIRAGEFYDLKSKGFLGVANRKSPDIEKAEVEINALTIRPYEYLLVKTMEKFNLPAEKVKFDDKLEPMYLAMHVYPRSTLQRCGIMLIATKTDAGYSGELTFGMVNLGGQDFEIELGARIANVVFMPVIGEIRRAYEGQWKGGRVSTGGVEKQI